MKKLTAIVLTLAMLFAFASCSDNSKDNDSDVRTELVTDTDGEAVTNNEGEYVTEIVTEAPSGTTETTAEETTLEPVSMPSDDPSKWTDEEIVEFYKNAAIRSKGVKSKQVMTMTDIAVNDGDGFLGVMVDFMKPIFKAALEKNSTEFDGITGGYENLSVADTKSVKAYKSGEYTVVEMTMKEQTDGVKADRYSGTVGHAISVVGDIQVVQEELPTFKMNLDEADIKLRYTNSKLKVKINKDGIIEKGTWTYDVYITVANLTVEPLDYPFIGVVEVDSAYGSVGYIITTGGGF